MSVVICFGIYLAYLLLNRLLGIYEYKVQHTKREERWKW